MFSLKCRICWGQNNDMKVEGRLLEKMKGSGEGRQERQGMNTIQIYEYAFI
jgi:hypothetical protein